MKDEEILKYICRKMYLFGLGDIWYEKGVIGDDTKKLYVMYSASVFATAVIIVGLETLAGFYGDFPEDQKNDAIALALSHMIDIIKISSVLFKKKDVKIVIGDVIRTCERYEKPDIMERKYKVMKYNMFAYIMLMFLSALFYYFEAIRKVLQNGDHYVAIVTYWPKNEEESLMATVIRVLISIITTILLLLVVSMDGFTVSFLIIIKYKFLTLRNYFNDISELLITKKYETLDVELNYRFKQGIVMHQQVLGITRRIDKIFNTLLSMHVCKSYMSAVSLLISITYSEQQSIAYTLKASFFIFALIFLLALFLCNAGEITHQASKLSESIFYSGWHRCTSKSVHKDLGQLVLVTNMICQRPLTMKAFHIFNLTYGMFISVVRGIYSVFTLVEARRNLE